MRNLDLEDLFKRYLVNRCSPKEIKKLFEYFNTDNESYLRDFIMQELSSLEPFEDSKEEVYLTRISEKLYINIAQNLRDKRTSEIRKISWSKFIPYAAAIAIFLCLPIYFYQQKKSNSMLKLQEDKNIVALHYQTIKDASRNDSDEIELELEGGEIIDLYKNDSTRFIVTVGKVAVTKQGEDLRYNLTSPNSYKDITPVYHRIKVPYGKRINVELPDGSRIALNSGSELRYPINLKNTEMSLYLKGEGFFDVARNKNRKFKVHVDGYGLRKDYAVQVLGTKFNVKSFIEDDASKITLIEGLVSLSGLSEQELFLTPNMQAVVEKGVSIGQADIESVMAWQNGNFFFKNSSLYSVCMELGRWYGVDFQLDKSLENIQFYFNVSRSTKLEEILAVLAQNEKLTVLKDNNVIMIRHR